MRCAACGAESPSGAKFCDRCGAALAAACPGCGHPNRPGARFCSECGAPLAGAAEAIAPPRPPAAPESYTPRHLAEKILAGRDALAGERKQATVLFADIAGSTELIQDLDTEAAQRLLDGAVRVMMDAVHRYEGMVSRVMGDGIMALFGAPIAHEDHAVRACFAALALEEGIQRYAEEVFTRHALRLQARVGLNSGEVIVRLVSDDLHMDYTALGQTVHLAARMEQLAAAGSSALTEQTLRLVEGYVRVRSLGRPTVKGLAEPIEVFELLGAGMVRTRFQAAAARGLTRFVGRLDELVAVHRAQEQAKAGHGQLAALVGEPGVGKSRLVWEVTRSHRTEGWTVLEAGSVSYGTATSWLPVIDLLKAYCHIEPSDDSRAIREKITGKLLALDEGLRPALPPLLSLLDVPTDDPGWEALDPPQRRRATLDAVQRLLVRESRVQPLLLVFEDLHWIDAETQALLDGLVDGLPTARILLLVNYRPEYAHGWGNRSYYTQLRIDPLGQDGAREILAALLGDDPSLQSLKALLMARTNGNPFFLEESVRALVETGALVGERGAYRLARPVDEIQVPATVQAVLAARIDRLSASEKRLLQTAAVIGKDVPFSVLQAVADIPDGELEAGLARLQAAELLYAVSLFPEPEYTFKHALTHEVAYGGLLQERRKILHAHVVEAIERVYATRLEEQTERLAHHALRAASWEQAVSYCRKAALRTAGRSAYREALTWLTQALTAVEHVTDRRDARELELELHMRVANTAQAVGDLDRNLHHLREAERLARQLGDQLRTGQATVMISQDCWVRGDQDRAIELGSQALEIAEALDDFGLRALATYMLGAFNCTVGEYGAARDFLLRVREMLAGQPTWRTPWSTGGALHAVVSRNHLATALAEQGDFAAGLLYAREAIEIAHQVSNAYNEVAAAYHVGLLHLRRGEVTGAIDDLAPALELCHVAALDFWEPRVGSALGYAYALAGRTDEGVPLVERAVRQAEEGRNVVYQALRVACLGEALLLAGRPDEARQAALRALELARTYRERGHEGWALRLVGEIAARRDPPDVGEAEVGYREALALAQELGMRPLEAHCYLGLGKLYRRAGRTGEVRAELSAALEMLRSMGMALWVAQAEAELAQLTGVRSETQAGG